MKYEPLKFRCHSAADGFHHTNQTIDLQGISNVGGAFRELKIFSLLAGKMLLAHQSGKSKNLHQPFGLMSPCTTSQDRGGRNSVQAAQVSPFFGRS
jgi:hypothetical protein